MSRTMHCLEKLLTRCLFMGMLALILLRIGGTTAVTFALSCGQWNLIPQPAARRALLFALVSKNAGEPSFFLDARPGRLE